MDVLRRARWMVLIAAAAGCGANPAPEPPAVITELAVPGRVNATPWIAARGDTVAVVWGATTPAGQTDVFMASSVDAGRTFTAPRQVNPAPGDARLGGEFPPRVAIAATGSGRGSDLEVVVLWSVRDPQSTVKITRSRDGGRTFDTPTSLVNPDAAGQRGWPALAIDDRGRAHAIWLDHRGMSTGRPGGSHTHTHTTTPAATDTAIADAVAMAQKSALYYASSGDEAAGGRALATGVCYCCKTALAAAGDGSLFAAWRHVYPGNLRDIAFTSSPDRGRSFGDIVRVSEDQWAVNGCPDDGPAIALDDAGTVHVAWPTVLPGDPVQGALFYASTRDGRTFTPRVQIPTLGGRKPTHPQIVAGADGTLAVGWDELVEGARIAAVRTVARGAGGVVTFGPETRLGPDTVALYPVLGAVSDGLVAAWTRGALESSTIAVQRLARRRP